MSPDTPAAGNGRFERGDEQVLHDWGIWSLRTADFTAPDGEVFNRTYVHSPGAVAVVPIVVGDDGVPMVVFVDQYRGALDRLVREIPAGMRDVAGEPPEDTAGRELIEETGFAAGTLTFLTEYLPSSGLTDATMRLYLGTDLRPAAVEAHSAEERHMTVVQIPLAEALRQVRSGEIVNVAAVVGLLLTAERWSGLTST